MTKAGTFLLLADEVQGSEIISPFGAETVCHVDDPYALMMELSQEDWPAVLVTAPRADLAGLCRAVRRLQHNASLFVLCTPTAEPEARELAGTLIDDYFILPMRVSDVQRVREKVSGWQAKESSGMLAGAEVSDLVTAARSPGELEELLVRKVSAKLGRPVQWQPADTSSGTVLLSMPGELGRELVCASAAGTMPRSSRGYLAALQDCLPALARQAERTESLHRLAITDHLTGAYNRRYFYHLTDQILSQAGGSANRITLLLYDIDDFKRYNDTYGHAAGDEILRDTARLMKQVTRTQDVVARIGGDEFAVLFWDAEQPRVEGSTPPDTAHVLANRFLQAVSRHEFRSLGPEATGALTISGGLARYPRDGKSCRQLLRSADEALQQAKEAGKAAIHLIGSTDEDES